jgi:hypothetical protein
MSNSSSPNFSKLNSTNYTTWVGEMEAWLCSSDLWRLVSGKSTKPALSTPPTTSEIEKLEKWEIKADKAARWIYLMVEPDQRIHLTNIRDDPIKMWEALESVHLQSAQEHASMHIMIYSQSESKRMKHSKC